MGLKVEMKAVNVNVAIKVVNGGELFEWANSAMSVDGSAQGEWLICHHLIIASCQLVKGGAQARREKI